MKKTTVLLCFSFAICVVKAQTVTPTVLSNNGGYGLVGSQGSLSWTIGEPVSETYSVPTHIVTMGLHQPDLGFVTLIKEQGDIAELLVFPNPVRESLTVSFKDLESGTYKMELMDNLGKLVFVNDVVVKDDCKLVNINMSQYAAGNYFLRVASPTLIKTVKINKIY